jgi:cytochrome c-type biogenesis protein CcmF
LSAHGTVLAHGGLGLIVIGVVLLSVWKQELITTMKPGETAELAGYAITFTGEEPLKGPNYDGVSGVFRIMRAGREVATVKSEKRAFKPSRMPTTEVGLIQGFFGDVYIVMGDQMADGRSIRITFNPLASWIWLGALIMFLGGLLSLGDRRLRIGVPQKPQPVAPAAALQQAAE